jgi:membrane-associated phospholipid phosphatase
MLSFVYLEQRDVRYNIVHCALDDYIPFCEYFIIPYVLWYVFLVLTVCYFTFRCKNQKEYWQLIGVLGIGMTVFLIVSFVYPNAQNLRPVLQEGNLFVQAVKVLYQIDTPTNILPSIHVFNTMACCVAICKNQDCRKYKKFIFITKLLAVLIILSTMFLKQHSVVDVSLALILYAVCYQVAYKMIPYCREQPSGHCREILNGRS